MLEKFTGELVAFNLNGKGLCNVAMILYFLIMVVGITVA